MAYPLPWLGLPMASYPCYYGVQGFWWPVGMPMPTYQFAPPTNQNPAQMSQYPPHQTYQPQYMPTFAGLPALPVFAPAQLLHQASQQQIAVTPPQDHQQRQKKRRQQRSRRRCNQSHATDANRQSEDPVPAAGPGFCVEESSSPEPDTHTSKTEPQTQLIKTERQTQLIKTEPQTQTIKTELQPQTIKTEPVASDDDLDTGNKSESAFPSGLPLSQHARTRLASNARPSRRGPASQRRAAAWRRRQG